MQLESDDRKPGEVDFSSVPPQLMKWPAMKTIVPGQLQFQSVKLAFICGTSEPLSVNI